MFSFLFVVILLSTALGMKPMEPCNTGSITYYTGFDSGSCGFKALTGETGPGYTTCAALNEGMINGAEKCGVCYEIVGPLGAMRVMITDTCPKTSDHCGGPMTHFDLTGSDTFAKVQDVKAGVSNITYRMVSCDVSGNIKAKIKDGSTQYWSSFLFFNHRTQINKVEYKSTDGSWVTINRASYNQYEINNPPIPFEVRLTSIKGDTISYTFNSIEAGKIVDLGGQFEEVDWKYGGASKGCCTAPDNWATVIGDSVGGIWEDWSSGATLSQDTSAPHSGSACLKVDITRNWGELQLGSDFGPSSSSFTDLTFYLKRAESTSSEATLKFSYGSVSESKTLTDIPTTWTKYTIPNSDVLSSTQQIRTINLQSNVAGTFYFDDMKFTLSGDGLPSKCADNVDNDGTSAGASSLKASALLVASALALIALFK